MSANSNKKNSDGEAEAELELDKFKEMIRNSNNEGHDALNRSQEFVGGDDYSFSPRSGRPKVPVQAKAKAGVLKSPDRPDDWLGSPGSAKRKSYKVKNLLPSVMAPPNLDGESAHSNSKPPAVPVVKAAPGGKSSPAGLTRHTLGASSSHHESTFASPPPPPMDKGSNHSISKLAPDPEKFKAMMRDSINQQADLNRSQEFLGGSGHELNSSFHDSFNSTSSNSKTKAKWGAPESPEQFRPDDWLGTPSSAKHKTYSVKNSPVVSPIPNLDDDDDDAPKNKASAGIPLISASSPKVKPRKIPVKAQSLAIGASAPKTATGASARPVGRPVGLPVKSQSLGLGQRSPLGISPIQKEERVDRNKFVKAFSAFEGQSAEPPSGFVASSPQITSPKRNFRVSKEAKAKSDSLRGSLEGLNASSTHLSRPRQDWTPLNQAISQLRKVALHQKPTSDDEPCEQQAWEIIQIIKHLKHNRVVDDVQGADSFLHIIQNLRRESLLAAHLGTAEVNEINGPLVESIESIVKQLDYKEPHRLELEVCARILNQLSSSNPRSIGMLEDVIGRLKKIPNDDLKPVTERMEKISWSVGKREVEELANVIRNSEPVEMTEDASTQWDELTRVLCSLDQLVDDVSRSSGFFERMGDSSASLSMPEYSPRGRNTIISPQANARRNFTVSGTAKLKSMAVLDLSAHSIKSEPDEELQMVLANLRRTVITPKNVDKSGQQASELLQMVQQLRKTGGGQGSAQKELFDLFEDLNRQGVFSSNLGPNRMEELRKVIKCLSDIGQQTDYNLEVKEELAGTVKYLRKLTPTSAGAVEMIQQAISRLRKVVPNMKDPSGVDDAIDQLQQIVLSMREGQEAELAEVIRDLKEDGDGKKDNSMDELEHVLAGLKAKRSAAKKAEEEKAKELADRAKARLKPEDADYLVHALLKLKKAKMNKKEAAAVAGFLRNLRPVQTPEEEKASDEALTKLRKQIDTNKKSREMLRVLKGLRRLNLNDPERFELAEIVRSLGKGESKYRDEITDAIAKLRKVQMTRSEAREAAGIMFNLRKVKKRGFDINNSREMVNLRKVVNDEKAVVIAEVFQELGNLDLAEKEVDEFAAVVAELEVQPLEPTDHQLITIEYVDGQPFMVLNIPYGKDYAQKMKNLGISDHIKKKKTYRTREIRFWIELEPDDELSDELLNEDDSDFEEASDGEEGSPSGKKKRLTIKMKARQSSTASPKPSPKPSPRTSSKPKVPKTLKHYSQESDEQSLVDDEEREKKIRFSTKPQWRFKKHNTTVVSEKRWRFEEGFNADEVIWSPLSRDQYDRRKTVGASILATMDKFAPLDDMLLDEFEKDGEGDKKK